MAKTESTAVNSLIDLVQSNQNKPIVDPSDDLFGPPKQPAPLPRSRAPGGTSQLMLPEHRPSVRTTTAPPSRGTTIPPIPRVARAAPKRPSTLPEGTPPPAIQARPPTPSLPTLPQPVRATSSPALPPSPRATPAPAPDAKRATSPTPAQLYAKSKTGPAAIQARIDMTGDMVRGDDWFEQSRAVEKFEDQTYVGTSPHVLHDRHAARSLVKKLILPGIGFIIVGAVIGGFIALNSSGMKKVVAKAPAAHVTPATQPTAQNAALAAEVAHGANPGVPTASPIEAPATEQVAATVPATAETHDVQTTRGVVKLADVRIDSLPAGATVTLVEKTSTGEKKSFLGTTPIATSLDPTGKYEVVLALAGHPDQIAELDPAHTPHLQVALAKAGRATPAQPAIAKAAPSRVAAAPKAAVHHSAPPKSEQLADPGFDSTPAPEAAKPTEKAEKPEKPAAVASGGTLMISSKPPCEIEIDGKSTGLRTPQRAMPLPAGAHKVTLVNSDANVNKTLMVQINPGQSTKLVKDLTGN
ncbi:MAG: PEGA domain-containing protein [Deltaproteobacteria bacterium]